MRLGIDASNLRVGGGVTHLIELLTAARPLQHGIETITVWGGQRTLDHLPAECAWLSVQPSAMLEARLPMRLAWQRWRLPRLAGKSCDLLFVPGGTYWGDFEPFVTMSRNLLPFEAVEAARYRVSGRRLKLAMLRWQQVATLRRAGGVIFLNEYARRTVMPVLRQVRGATAIVPHGVSAAFYRPPRPQRSARTGDEPFRLLYVSTVDLYKHQWRVVEAVATLRRQRWPVVLTLIGGAYRPALRRLRRAIERSDPDHAFVEYRGEMPYRCLPELYHRADLFVFASSCENMPNTLLEAMAAGLPIACAARGPMPAILGDGGVYFDPERAESIEAALRGLLEDAALREITAARAYRAAQAYTWARCAAATLGFLARVA